MKPRFYVIMLFIASALSIVAQENVMVDSIEAPQKRGLINKIINYFNNTNNEDSGKRFDWSVIGGPFYSSDVHFGIGVVAGAQYRVSETDTVTQPSVASLKLQGSTTLFYSIGLIGTNIFPQDRGRINYDITFSSLPTYFWGIGYEEGRNDKHKTKYTDLSFTIKTEGLFRVANGLYVGPALELDHTATRRIEDPSFFGDMPLRVTSFGGGGTLYYDTRDFITGPTQGWLVEVNAKAFPRFLGNTSHSFVSTEMKVCNYNKVWKGGILAWRLHSQLTFGHTPWNVMPALGDRNVVRGYYQGRYRDKCEADFTLELRQHVWRRSGIVVWGGFGTVFPKVSALRFYQLLPSIGVGYRWEFKKHANVRLDFGVGKGSYAIEFSINEAF